MKDNLGTEQQQGGPNEIVGSKRRRCNGDIPISFYLMDFVRDHPQIQLHRAHPMHVVLFATNQRKRSVLSWLL